MKIFTYLFLLTVFFHVSCEEEMESDCTTVVTVRDFSGFDGCGFIFELENGEYLEPYPNTDNPEFQQKYNEYLVDGRVVTINYIPKPEMASICMVGQIVEVSCIDNTAISSID